MTFIQKETERLTVAASFTFGIETIGKDYKSVYKREKMEEVMVQFGKLKEMCFPNRS